MRAAVLLATMKREPLSSHTCTQMVLDMASAGMLSALDVEGVPPKPSS